MVPTTGIYSIQFGFWPPQLHQHLHPHSTCHLNYPDLHWHQYLHLCDLYWLQDSSNLYKKWLHHFVHASLYTIFLLPTTQNIYLQILYHSISKHDTPCRTRALTILYNIMYTTDSITITSIQSNYSTLSAVYITYVTPKTQKSVFCSKFVAHASTCSTSKSKYYLHTWSIFLEQNLTAQMPLLTATIAFKLGIRR